MLAPVVSAVGFAFILAFLPGPVFFGVIQTSIQKSFRHALFFALGVALSDMFFVLATYFGIAAFADSPTADFIIRSAGGCALAVFGLFYFFKPESKKVPLNPIQKETKKGNFILKGFFLNGFNPSAFFYWITLVSVITVRFEHDLSQILIFFIALLITVFLFDSLKAYVANKIKKYFTNSLILVLNKVLGFILLIIGINFILVAFTGKGIIT
ncbi:MAG: LysE family translocator [Cytophagaceae bacterium]